MFKLKNSLLKYIRLLMEAREACLSAINQEWHSTPLGVAGERNLCCLYSAPHFCWYQGCHWFYWKLKAFPTNSPEEIDIFTNKVVRK
jgi:hypothetical protein